MTKTSPTLADIAKQLEADGWIVKKVSKQLNSWLAVVEKDGEVEHLEFTAQYT